MAARMRIDNLADSELEDEGYSNNRGQ